MSKDAKTNRRLVREVVASAAREYSLALPDKAYINFIQNGGCNAIVESIMSGLSSDDINNIVKTQRPEIFHKNVRRKIGLNEDGSAIQRIADEGMRELASKVEDVLVDKIDVKSRLLKVGVKRVSPVEQIFIGIPTRMDLPTIKGREFSESVTVNINEMILEKVYELAWETAKDIALKPAVAGLKTIYTASVGGLNKINAINNIYSGIGSFLNSKALQTKCPFIGKITKAASNHFLKASTIKLGWGPLLSATNFGANAVKAYNITFAKQIGKKVAEDVAKKVATRAAMRYALRSTLKAAKMSIEALDGIGILKALVEWFVSVGIDYLIRKEVNKFAEALFTADTDFVQALYNKWALNPNYKALDVAIDFCAGRSLRDIIISLAAQKHFMYAIEKKNEIQRQSVTGQMLEGASGDGLKDVYISKEHLIREITMLHQGDTKKESEELFFVDTQVNKILGFKWIYHPVFGLALRPEKSKYQKIKAELSDNTSVYNDEICVYHGYTIYGEYSPGTKIVVKKVNLIGNETRNFDREFESMFTQLLHIGIDVKGTISSYGLDTTDIRQFVKNLNTIQERGNGTAKYVYDGEEKDAYNNIGSVAGEAGEILKHAATNPVETIASIKEMPIDIKSSIEDLLNMESEDAVINALKNNKQYNKMFGKVPGEFTWTDNEGVSHQLILTSDGTYYELKDGQFSIFSKSECAKKAGSPDIEQVYTRHAEEFEKQEIEKVIAEYGYNYTFLTDNKTTYETRNKLWKYANSLLFGSDYKCGDVVDKKRLEVENNNRLLLYRRGVMRSIVFVNGESARFVEYLETQEMNSKLARRWYQMLAHQDKVAFSGHNLQAKQNSFFAKILENAEIVWPYTETYGYQISNSQNTTISNRSTELPELVVTPKLAVNKQQVNEDNNDTSIPQTQQQTSDIEQHNDAIIDYNSLDDSFLYNNYDYDNDESWSNITDNLFNENQVYKILTEPESGFKYITVGTTKYYLYHVGNNNYILTGSGVYLLDKNGRLQYMDPNKISVYTDQRSGISYVKIGNRYYDWIGRLYKLDTNGDVIPTFKTQTSDNQVFKGDINLIQKKNAIAREMNINGSGYYKFIAKMCYIASQESTDERFRKIFAGYAWPGARSFFNRKDNILSRTGVIDAKCIIDEKMFFGNIIVNGNL